MDSAQGKVDSKVDRGGGSAAARRWYGAGATKVPAAKHAKARQSTPKACQKHAKAHQSTPKHDSKCSQLGGASIVSVSVGQVAAPPAFITPHDSHAPPVGGGRLNRLTPVRRKRSRVRANKRAAFAPKKAKKLARGAEFVRTSARLSLQRSWHQEGCARAAPAPRACLPRLRPAPRPRPAPASGARAPRLPPTPRASAPAPPAQQPSSFAPLLRPSRDGAQAKGHKVGPRPSG